MKPDPFDALRQLIGPQWHLDRPVTDATQLHMRLVRRSPHDIHDELSRDAAALRHQLGKFSWWSRRLDRRPISALQVRLTAITQDMLHYVPGSTSPPASVSPSAWTFARPPDKPSDDFSMMAAISYELAGRAFEFAERPDTVIINTHIVDVDRATGHSQTPCVLAVKFDRARYERQRHERVVPALAVRRVFSHRTNLLGGPDSLTEIRPIELHEDAESDALITPKTAGDGQKAPQPQGRNAAEGDSDLLNF